MRLRMWARGLCLGAALGCGGSDGEGFGIRLRWGLLE